MNYQTDLFHKNLIKVINECGLPIGIAYFVMKDCLNELKIGYDLSIIEENPNNQQEEEQIIEIDKNSLKAIDADAGEVEIC